MSPRKTGMFGPSRKKAKTKEAPKTEEVIEEDVQESVDEKEVPQNSTPKKSQESLLKKIFHFSIKEKVVEDSLTEKESSETIQERRFFSIAVLVILGTLVLYTLAFIVMFLYSVRGSEETVVPDVIKKEITTGILELQEHGLTPRIQVTYSDDPHDKGLILEQKPAAGTYVRAGRKVNLTISKGAVIDTVGDYIGNDINEVSMELETLFLTYKPILKVKQPVVYVYDESEAGTILQQSPEPGTEITGLTELEFLVSRGPADLPIEIDNYLGLSTEEALKKMALGNSPFIFKIDNERTTAQSEVVSQVPSAGDKVMPGTIQQLSVSTPKKLSKNHQFGLFDYELPNYETYVQLKVEKLDKDNQRSLLFITQFMGGRLTFPYEEEIGTVLIISVFNKEVYRYQVLKE